MRILRVSEVNRAVKGALESDWGDVWIEGELSDVTRAASGHVYFTLNDGDDPAQLRGVMFRGDARRAKAQMERGDVVRVRGTLTLYEPRGTFQLIARIALPAGEGDLHAQFERIRRKLESEGLTDAARKRSLPRFPKTIGVVTSASGAAMHDIIRVSHGRCPVRIVVADCRVQGQEAPASILSALTEIQRLEDLDVVIVGRGGGSAEDLWAFNHEGVARAIAACRVPVVSAVGHEVDVTIADLVADVRASTPSNAAEVVVPDGAALRGELDASHRHVQRAFETRLGRERLRLERMTSELTDPRHALAGAQKELGTLSAALDRASQRILAGRRAKLRELTDALGRHDARATLARDREELVRLQTLLLTGIKPWLAGRRSLLGELAVGLHAQRAPLLADRRARLEAMMGRLHALSPLSVLARGYAIAIHEPTGKALLRAGDAKEGDGLRIVLQDGQIGAEVRTTEPPEKPTIKVP